MRRSVVDLGSGLSYRLKESAGAVGLLPPAPPNPPPPMRACENDPAPVRREPRVHRGASRGARRQRRGALQCLGLLFPPARRPSGRARRVRVSAHCALRTSTARSIRSRLELYDHIFSHSLQGHFASQARQPLTLSAGPVPHSGILATVCCFSHDCFGIVRLPVARSRTQKLKINCLGILVTPLVRCTTMTRPQRAREVRSIGAAGS